MFNQMRPGFEAQVANRAWVWAYLVMNHPRVPIQPILECERRTAFAALKRLQLFVDTANLSAPTNV